jgi:hypothetical protein
MTLLVLKIAMIWMVTAAGAAAAFSMILRVLNREPDR